MHASDGVYVPCTYSVWWRLCTLYLLGMVEFMYLVLTRYGGVYVPCTYSVWWSLCTTYLLGILLTWQASKYKVHLVQQRYNPLVALMYFVFTRHISHLAFELIQAILSPTEVHASGGAYVPHIYSVYFSPAISSKYKVH